MNIGTVKIFFGRLIIIIEDEFFEVQLYHSDKKLKKNIAYITNDSEYVKIYRGKYKKDEYLPGWYMNNEKELIEIQPNKDVKKLYHINNIRELNIDRIFENVESNERDFIQPEDIEVINNNSEVYIPTIKDDDDFLKYLVKKIIIDKKINLKNYKGRFINNYSLTNMKSGLNRTTKMTVTNFKLWMEILGIQWEIIVTDSGEDKLNPLPEPIKIKSEDF